MMEAPKDRGSSQAKRSELCQILSFNYVQECASSEGCGLITQLVQNVVVIDAKI